eukprot:249105_1
MSTYKANWHKQKHVPKSYGTYLMKLSTSCFIKFSETGIELQIPPKQSDNKYSQISFEIATKKKSAISMVQTQQWKTTLKNNFIQEYNHRYESEYTDHLIQITRHRLTESEQKTIGTCRMDYYQKIMETLFNIIKPQIKFRYDIPSESFDYLK